MNAHSHSNASHLNDMQSDARSVNRTEGDIRLRSQRWLRQIKTAWFSRDRIVQNLEWIQDFIIISLCIGQFSIMLIRLGAMFGDLLKPSNFQVVTSDILFILILVELFRLLVIYLKEQRISVGAAIEVSIVSVLREVIVQGVLEIPLSQTLGVCAFLFVLGWLLFLRMWMTQDVEQRRNCASFETLSDPSHASAIESEA